jgi:hypothetical protein
MPAENHFIEGEGGKKICPIMLRGCERILKLERKMEKFDNAVQENREINARIEQKLEHGNKEFKTLNQYLIGNGQPGIIDRLTRVETSHKLLLTLCTGAVITSTGAIVSALIQMLK